MAQGEIECYLQGNCHQTEEKSPFFRLRDLSLKASDNQPQRSGKAGPDDEKPGRDELPACSLRISPQAAGHTGGFSCRADHSSGGGDGQGKRAQAKDQRQGGGQKEQSQQVWLPPEEKDGGYGVDDQGGDEEEVEEAGFSAGRRDISGHWQTANVGWF